MRFGFGLITCQRHPLDPRSDAELYADALALAEEAATVDLLSSGRLVLGLGLGWRAEEFEVLGVPQRGLERRLEEIIATLRMAWSADGLVDGASVTPKPAQAGGPPIWLG